MITSISCWLAIGLFPVIWYIPEWQCVDSLLTFWSSFGFTHRRSSKLKKLYCEIRRWSRPCALAPVPSHMLLEVAALKKGAYRTTRRRRKVHAARWSFSNASHPGLESWQLQSLHMVTWCMANHNKGFETMTTPSSFNISIAGPGFVDLSAVRDWQRCWSTTRHWQSWNWEATVLVIPVLRLGVWWGWWGFWGTGHEGEMYCSRDRDRANRRWNGEMSERKTIHRGYVLSLSSRSEWIWVCSFHFIADHMICAYQRKYEKNAGEGVEISCMWISIEF